MTYFGIPECPLTPPEDTRARVYRCAICGEDILEGDEYYEIPGFGICCEPCINEAHHYDAELDYPERERGEEY